jgi:membrane protein insertase Oxa1/YidC/SpoIIIJ
MLGFLDNLLLQPLMAIYAAIFESLPGSMGPGYRLIVFSLVINLLLLPVYYQMERNSRRIRAVRDDVARDVERMRRHFRGRERFFYVRAVHRQHRYHPLSALLGSFDLFLQILIFATVYRFLSGLEALQGQPFWVIPDLGRPDALLGGINLLPLLMTGINVASVFVYADDPRHRLQALLLAGLFLVLLYGSPSGLVLYWTANNLFSLLRNVFERRLLPRLPASRRRPFAALANLR